MEFISEGIFGKYSKMKTLVLTFLKKDQILRPFSGLAPSKLKIFPKNFKGRLCVPRGIVDTIFMGRENRPWPRGLKQFYCNLVLFIVTSFYQ